MILGDRVRLPTPFGQIAAGSEGVVTRFYRHPDGLLVAVIFDEQTEKVPEACLAEIDAGSDTVDR
jgi:hypothetical protein